MGWRDGVLRCELEDRVGRAGRAEPAAGGLVKGLCPPEALGSHSW